MKNNLARVRGKVADSFEHCDKPFVPYKAGNFLFIEEVFSLSEITLLLGTSCLFYFLAFLLVIDPATLMETS